MKLPFAASGYRLGLGVAVLVSIAAAPPSPSQIGARIVAHGTASGALPCMACHGDHLQGNLAIGAPRLAGLKPTVTRAALQSIATGTTGKNYVMTLVARSLNHAQRRAVAAYLASLPAAP